MRTKPIIALSTGSLHCYGLSRTFELAKEAGFENIELMVDDRWDTRQPSYLKTLAATTGLRIVCLHSPFLPHIPGWKKDEINRLKETLRMAESLEAMTVVTHLPIRWTKASLRLPFIEKSYQLHLPIVGDGAYTRFLTQELRDFQAETKVTIAVENMPYNLHLFGRKASLYGLNTTPKLAQFDHLNFDTTHFATHGQDILEVYDQLGPRVAHVHLSNYRKGQEHRALWDGELPLDKLLRRLAVNNYDRVVSIELEPNSLGASSEDAARKNLRKSYEFCREHLN